MARIVDLIKESASKKHYVGNKKYKTEYRGKSDKLRRFGGFLSW